MKLRKNFFTGVASVAFLAGAFAATPLVAQNHSFNKNTVAGFTTLYQSTNNSSSKSNKLSTSFTDVRGTDMEISPWEKRIGLTGAFGEGSTSLTAGFSHLYGFGSSRRFKLGYGIRLSSFFGSDREFSAAPPDLAAEENPQFFFVGETPFPMSNDKPSNSQLNAINLGIYTDYSITDNLLIGFNIDVIGFSFGAEKEGAVYDNTSIDGMTLVNNTSATPTNFNLLLVGNNDKGTLNSEFWIGYRIASNVMVRGAFSYLFTEYTTEGQYKDNNDRFRYKAAQGALGVSYTF